MSRLLSWPTIWLNRTGMTGAQSSLEGAGDDFLHLFGHLVHGQVGGDDLHPGSLGGPRSRGTPREHAGERRGPPPRTWRWPTPRRPGCARRRDAKPTSTGRSSRIVNSGFRSNRDQRVDHLDLVERDAASRALDRPPWRREPVALARPSLRRAPGWITSSMCCSRAAAYRKSSARGMSPLVEGSSRIERTRSPTTVPPGSRVIFTSTPRPLRYSKKQADSVWTCRIFDSLERDEIAHEASPLHFRCEGPNPTTWGRMREPERSTQAGAGRTRRVPRRCRG